MSLQTGHLARAYLEITNLCTAACSFCPGHRRSPRQMSEAEFLVILDRLQGRVDTLYFHLMGEPLLHPQVIPFAVTAKARGYHLAITSNGILARDVGIPLVESGCVDKISLSLHSYEANAFAMSLETYLDGCLALAETAIRKNTVCALRLWNRGGDSDLNEAILSALHRRFGDDWQENRWGYRLRGTCHLEWGDRFDWPGEGSDTHAPRFCHALRSQIGILCDGTVVPCCLDGEGRMPLGNLFTDSFEAVLASRRAKALYDGFSAHVAVEPLCRTCGYAERFSV